MKKAILIILSIMLVLSSTLPASAISTIAVKGIKLNNISINLNVGQTSKLVAVLTPSNTTQKKLTYVTGNIKVATVNGAGEIKGVGEGSTTITVYTINNKIFAKCSITVLKPADPFGKYKTPITLTAVKYSIANWTYLPNENIENNYYTKEIEKTLGINVKYNWTADSSEYVNKLNITLASGEMPDFFQCDSRTFKNLADNEQLADLTNVYEKYASPRIKSQGASFPQGFASAKIDGKLLALPLLGYGIITAPQIMWIRDDWMKKYNLTAPKTMDDLMKIAATFKANVPNSYGLAVQKDFLIGGMESIIPLANAYHAYPAIWIKNADGKIVYGSIQPEMKKVLKLAQDMYKNGMIDKEFGVKDVNKVNEDIINGKVGIMLGPEWLCYWPGPDALKKDINAVWRPYPMPSTDNVPVQLQSPWPITQYFVVSKECKYPEAVVKMLNLADKLDSLGLPVPKEVNNLDRGASPVWNNNPTTAIATLAHVSQALAKKDKLICVTDTERKDYDQAITWVDSKNIDGAGTYWELSSEGSLSVIKPYVDSNHILIDKLAGSLPSVYSEKKATLDKLELETFTKIIMGASMDEFDKFVNTWNKLGGVASTKAVNAEFNR